MFLPDMKIYGEVCKALPEKFLQDTCLKLKLTERESAQFFDALIRISTQYLELTRNNTQEAIKRQTRKIADFRKGLAATENAYNKVLSDTIANLRLDSISRTKYSNFSQRMKDMFHPYLNEGGYVKELLPEFFNLFASLAKEAETAYFDNQKIKSYKEVVKWWAAEIKLKWPKGAKYKFTLNDFIKRDAKGGGYKSVARDILCALMKRLDRQVTEKNVETAMRRIIEKKGELNPTDFLKMKKRKMQG